MTEQLARPEAPTWDQVTERQQLAIDEKNMPPKQLGEVPLGNTNQNTVRLPLDSTFDYIERNPETPPVPDPGIVEAFTAIDFEQKVQEATVKIQNSDLLTLDTPSTEESTEVSTEEPVSEEETEESAATVIETAPEVSPVEDNLSEDGRIPTLAEVEALKRIVDDATPEIVPENPLDGIEVNPAVMQQELANLPTAAELEETGVQDFLETIAAGDRKKVVLEELEKYAAGEDSKLTKFFKLIDFIASPLMAPIAFAAAPIANPSKAESFIGSLIENFQTAADAAGERLTRYSRPVQTGGIMPFYGREIVDRYMTAIPEQYRDAAGIVMELLLDPTIILGTGMARSMQRTMASLPNLTKDGPFRGILETSIYDLMGWSPEALNTVRTRKVMADKLSAKKKGEVKELEAMLALAAIAKTGGPEGEAAFRQLMELTRGKNIAGAVVGSDEAIEIVHKVMKGTPDSESFHIQRSLGADGKVDQALLQQSIQESVAFNEMRWNLNVVSDGESFIKTFDEAVKFYESVFDSAKSEFVSHASPRGEGRSVLIDLARGQNQLLADFMGMPIHHFEDKTLYAFRQILHSSVNQMAEYSIVMNSPSATKMSQDIAKVAFIKQLLINNSIQAKVMGVKSSAGQLLESTKAVVC